MLENMDGFRLARVQKINIYQECWEKNVCRRERACGAEVRGRVPKTCISTKEPQLVRENPCLPSLLPALPIDLHREEEFFKKSNL